MRLEFDQDLDAQGNVIATHYIESSDAVAQATLNAIKASPALQAQAGYSVISKHKLHGGKTRFQALSDAAITANDLTIRGILGV